jgi:hypothetical protein
VMVGEGREEKEEKEEKEERAYLRSRLVVLQLVKVEVLDQVWHYSSAAPILSNSF